MSVSSGQFKPSKSKNKKNTESADDKLRTAAVAYLEASNRSSTELQDLADKYPAIFEAHQIWQENGYHRHLLEAMIMTNVPTEEVALWVMGQLSDSGIELEIVMTYEMLFFDVRTHLKNIAYLYANVIPGAVSGDIDRSNPDLFYKVLALGLGYEGLTNYLSQDELDPEWKKKFRRVASGMGSKNYYAAEVGRAVNRHTQRFVVENQLNEQAIEVSIKQAGMDDTKADDATVNLVGGLGFTVSQVTQQSPGAEEPRAFELIQQQLESVNMEPDALPALEVTPKRTQEP